MRLRLLPMKRPCSESWDAMPGDAKTRWCDKCEKHVFDLSERTETEARALYRERGTAELCVRYAKDRTGGILFKAAAVAAVLSTAACTATVADPVPVTPAEVDKDMGDGVLDQVDQCPDEPNAAESEATGCPETKAPPPKQ